MKARNVKPGFIFADGRVVRWVMSPLAPGVHDLLPNGGMLITFTNSTQIGVEREDADVSALSPHNEDDDE